MGSYTNIHCVHIGCPMSHRMLNSQMYLWICKIRNALRKCGSVASMLVLVTSFKLYVIISETTVIVIYNNVQSFKCKWIPWIGFGYSSIRYHHRIFHNWPIIIINIYRQIILCTSNTLWTFIFGHNCDPSQTRTHTFTFIHRSLVTMHFHLRFYRFFPI